MKHIEHTTNEVIKKLSLSVPINLNEIAIAFNVQIKKAASDEFSGVLYRKDGIAFMAISTKESQERQRFTVAHEFGHFFLHQDKNTFIEFRNKTKDAVKSIKEREANQFAAALLMPKTFLEKDIKNLSRDSILENEIKYLAEKYKVSTDAMTYRLINLNLF